MIQINPLKNYIDGGVRAAITSPPSASLVFDLPGRAIWVKGVKLKGTDHTYTFNHDNYINLTNTPDPNNSESEEIKIGININTLKAAIDTTYGVVTSTANGLAPKFSNENKSAASAATTYHFLGWTGTTLKWYQAPLRNVRINSETTDCLEVNNTDPLIISAGNGINVTWDSTNKKIVITNSKPDVNHNTDSHVSQLSIDSDKNYPVILKYTDSISNEVSAVRYSSTLLYNPFSKQLKINGNKVITAADIFTGATASTDGAVGLVTKPLIANRNLFLRGDGTWATPTDTWRPIKVGGSEKLGSGTDTGSIDFVAGNGITLAWDATNKRITITNSKPHVADDTNTWRPIYLGGTIKLESGIGTAGMNLKAGSGVTITYAAPGTGSGLSGSTNYGTYTINASNQIPSDNVTGSGATNWIAKWSGEHTISKLVAISSTVTSQTQSTKFLREDGTWATPSYTTNSNTWRPVKVEGTEKLSSAINTSALDLSAGNGISIVYNNDTKKIIITNTKPDINHNTHYTTMMYIGENNDTKANKNIANPYLKLFDDNARRATFQIKGGTGITVGSDTNGNITITNSAPDVNHNTDEKVKLIPQTNNVDRPLMMINGGTSTGEQINTSIFNTGIYANTSTKMITSNGFKKTGSSDNYLLLGGGGHKAISDLLGNYVTLNTTQTITGVKTFAYNTFILAGIENSNIRHSTQPNYNWGGYGYTNTTPNYTGMYNSLDFYWYNDIWSIGNLRSCDSRTNGFGIGLKKTNNDGNIYFAPAFRVTETESYINNNKIWHAGNDGSGSGLDADLLDGKHANEFATINHTHDNRYLRWSNSLADTNTMGWGTLTAANGYSILSHASSSDGGDMGWVYKNGQISYQLDGFFYQNEGKYRLTDVSETVTTLSTSGNYLSWTKNGITNNITIPFSSTTHKILALLNLDSIDKANEFRDKSAKSLLVGYLASSVFTGLSDGIILSASVPGQWCHQMHLDDNILNISHRCRISDNAGWSNWYLLLDTFNSSISGGGSTGGSSITITLANTSKTLTIPTSLPASDVYDWAKQSTKPTYNFSEITPGIATIGDGSNRLMFRTLEFYRNGIYYSTPGNEALVFSTKYSVTSWIFATTDPNSQIAWTSLTPSLQIKNGRVTINKLIANDTDASYNLDVNGSANATALYENGVRVSINGHTHSYLPLSGGTLTNNLTIQTGGIWVQGGSAAGSDNTRMSLVSGMPDGLAYNTSKRGVRIYSNAIAFADPYNGNSNNDSGWIRHIETTGNRGILEIATGDDGNESIVVRRYNTSSAVVKEAYLLNSSGNTTFPGTVSASGFVKSGSSDSYVLLGGGGHKAVSDFATSGHTHSYIPLSGSTVISGTLRFNNESSFQGYMPRKREGGGGWAYEPFSVIDFSGSRFATFGVYGFQNSLGYIYIGPNGYDSNANMRIDTSGNVSAPMFVGALVGNAATATALTSSAGSSTTPVYFSGGKPVVCGSSLAVSITGNAATATKWATARTITLSGSVTGSVSLDGSGNVTLATTTNHTHSYADSPSAGGAATWLYGKYTGNGGQQKPNYFGSNKIGGLMMNTTINGNSQYKDFLIMDCYAGSDVGGAVAFGVNRQTLGAYIMRSAAERTAWAESAELIGTHNYTTYTVKKDGTGASGTWGISITGNADTVDGQHFSYSNSSNSPTYLWATNSNGSSFLAARGSISVNYANSAGAVAWDNVTSKPINFKAYSGSLANGGWEIIQGNNSSPSIAIAYNNSAASWNSGTYSATLVYGCTDTRGLLDCAYNTPIVTFGGCCYKGSNDNNPTWYMKISGTNGSIYNLNSMPYASSAGNADTLDGNHASAFALSGHTHSQYLTTHLTIYGLTIQANGTSLDTYTPNSASKTINITYSNVGAAAASHTHSYLPLAGGTMDANARIAQASGSLYIGSSTNTGWVYLQDMASQNGADYWKITQTGVAMFKNCIAETFFGALSGNATTATTASKLGSSTVGSGTQHFYLNEGTATASSSTVGGTAKPMYLSAGTMTAISATVGSTDTPVYLNGGTITSCGKSFSSYLPLSGGTMTGSIITPANDDMGIIPYNNNYGQIGSSTKKFFRMYATTFYGSLSGNASTASKWNTTRTLTIGNTGKSVNGSADVSWSLAEIGALPLTGGNLSGDLYVTRSTTSSIWARYSSSTAIRICAASSATHIQVGNFAWTANVPLYISGPNTNEGSTLYLKFSTVDASGSIYASHFYENSDIRYKRILKNLLINSNTIANLPLFDFEWIENNTIGTGTSALAVLKILPNIVSGNEKLTLDYGVLGTIAGITACKELVKVNLEIFTLKSELLQLKEKVKLLEDKLRKYENT